MRRVAAAGGILLTIGLAALVASPVEILLPRTSSMSLALLGGLIGVVGISGLFVFRMTNLREVELDAQPGTAPQRAGAAELLQVSRFEPFFVHRDGEEVGLVDEIICDARGNPMAVIVSAAWFGQDRFLVPIESVRSVELSDRRLLIDDCSDEPSTPP